MPIHVRGIVAGEEENRLGDLCRIGAAAHGDAVEHALQDVRVGGKGRRHRRDHVARRDGVDADALAGVVAGHGARDVDDAGLGGVVGAQAVVAEQARRAGGVDDGALALALHVRQRGAREVEDRQQVRRDDHLDVGERLPRHRVDRARVAGAVHEHVEPAVPRHARRHRRRAVARRADVAALEVRARAECLDDAALVQVDDEDVCAFGDQLRARREAEARRAAGDEDDAVGEACRERHGVDGDGEGEGEGACEGSFFLVVNGTAGLDCRVVF